MQRLNQGFIFFAAGIFATTACLKLVAVGGEHQFLILRDPIIPFMSVRQMFVLVGVLEISVAVYLIFNRSSPAILKLLAIAWMSSMFVLYRIGLWMVGYTGPCRCLGGEWAVIGLSKDFWETTIKIILALILSMSWGLVVWDLAAKGELRSLLFRRCFGSTEHRPMDASAKPSSERMR